MDAIVSVTSNWAIGRDGRLLVRNRADMRRFVQLTTGGTVLMGRKTYESFPKGPLKGRRNVILTRSTAYVPPNMPNELPPGTSVEVVHSLEEALATANSDGLQHDSAESLRAKAAACSSAGALSVWLIGGESVYRALLSHCERVYVTKNEVDVPDADAFFPDLDADPGWNLEQTQGGGTTEEGIPYEFVTYTRAQAR